MGDMVAPYGGFLAFRRGPPFATANTGTSRLPTLMHMKLLIKPFTLESTIPPSSPSHAHMHKGSSECYMCCNPDCNPQASDNYNYS
ncbi:hypothetical protein L195_g032980, partial [Trifolium pratense]